MNDDHKPFPTHAELKVKLAVHQAQILDLLAQIDHMREVEEQNAADLLDKSEHIERLIETAQAEQSENDTLRALNGDLRSLNAELMKQVADLQASEAQTYRVMDEVRHEASNVATGFQAEMALTAELQAEIVRLQVVEAQNAASLMGMNDQVIDMHGKLGVDRERADRLQRQNTEHIAEIRKLRLAQERVALQVKVLRKVARLLRNEVQI